MMTTTTDITAYVDGGSDQNGTYAGLLLIDSHTKELLYGDGVVLNVYTNNEAEYAAVLAAIYKALDLGAKRLLVYSDSKVIVNQINGEWLVHANNLKYFYDEIKDNIRNIHFEIHWIPRQQNVIADLLSRTARVKMKNKGGENGIEAS